MFLIVRNGLKKSHFTVTLTGQVFVVSWTVAHLATVHKMKQKLLRFISYICNILLCVECLTKCCDSRIQCAVCVGCICIQWTLRYWQCDSMVLGERFAVFERIILPSSSVSSGVCLDPEDDGTSHTATQCLIPNGFNLPTSTFGNLDSPSAYILPSCERWLCCYTATDCGCTTWLHTAHSVTACFSLAGCPKASICNILHAVQAITEQASLAVIVSHWSGSYRLTAHPFSWLGCVVGSGLFWNPATKWVSATVLLKCDSCASNQGLLSSVFQFLNPTYWYLEAISISMSIPTSGDIMHCVWSIVQ